jgi:amino-acid N-acetyltransferase
METQITVIPADNGNRPGIVSLLASQKLPVEDLPDHLNNFWIVEDKGEVIGVVGLELHPPFGLLRSLAVLPDYRNLGIGNMLVSAVEEQAIKLELKGIYLLTETAKSYFEKRGYVVVDRDKVHDPVKQSSEFSHVCPVSAAAMQKKIAEG